MRYRLLQLTTCTNGLFCNRSSPIGRDRALRCECTVRSPVQQPRPRWPRQTSLYAFSITSFQLTRFTIVVIINASDTECIFWTRPAATFGDLFICAKHLFVAAS